MKFIGFLLCLVTLLLSSCTIELAMQVNKDYSGNMALKVDMSQMFEMLSMFEDSISQKEIDSMVLDGGMEGFQEAFEEESIAKLKESGITNLTAGMEDGKFMVIRYDYADINNAYDFFFVLDTNATEEQIKELNAVKYFKADKDKLTINFNDEGLKDAMKGGMGDEMDGMEGMGDMDMSFMTSMLNIKQSYTFERPVTQVIDRNDLPIITKGNKVYYSVNLDEYQADFVGNSITVVFDDNLKVPESSTKKKKKKKKK